MVRSRIFALLLSGSAALESACDGGAESHSLLQRAGRTALKTKGAEALESLLATATHMLKDGATPEVISFSQDTLKAIKDEVLPAIDRDHAAQQQLVFEHHNATLMFTHTYSQWTERLLEAREMESQASHTHETCRATEHLVKHSTESCDTELKTRWERFQEVEEDMEDLSERIETEWCAPGVNRSMEDFRDEAVKKFTKYSHKKTTIHEVTVHYEEWVSVCQSNHTQLHEKRTECEEEQHQLETSACLSATLTQEAGNKLSDEWPMIAAIYNNTVVSVQTAEAARKKEFSTLTTVECLLTRIEERGGQPCDEGDTTGEAVREIEVCHNRSSNVTHLDVEVPPMPEMPHAPEPRPLPCSEEFVAQEYPGMEVAECRPCETAPEAAKATATTPSPGE